MLAVWHGDIAVVYAAASGLSAGAAFFNPASASLLPALVSEDELVAANSGIWSAAVLSQVVLAPLAGLLVTTAGYGWVFAANAGSFAVSAVILAGLRAREAPRPVVVSPVWMQAREPIALVARDRLLRALAVAQALAALSAGTTSALLVVLAARTLHTSGGGYGLLLAAIAAGAFTGPLLLARLPRDGRRPLVVFAAFGLRGLVDLVLATVTALPAALAALVCYGVGTSVGNITFSSVIQAHVPDNLRGRVFSAFDLIWQSMRLASLLVGGPPADTAGIRAVYYLGAGLLAGAALAGLTALGPLASEKDGQVLDRPAWRGAAFAIAAARGRRGPGESVTGPAWSLRGLVAVFKGFEAFFDSHGGDGQPGDRVGLPPAGPGVKADAEQGGRGGGRAQCGLREARARLHLAELNPDLAAELHQP